MKYLISTSETYRVDTEDEAKNLIEESKNDQDYILDKYSCVHKQKVSKGEILDEWQRVTLVKLYNNEKDPILYEE